MKLVEFTSENTAVRVRNTVIRVYIDTPSKLAQAITTLLVELSACFPDQSPPTSDSKPLPCGRHKSLTLAFNKPLNNAKATHDTY